MIFLNDADLAKIRQQGWEKHPDFRGQAVVVRESFLGGKHRLAQRRDGRCVFLTDAGLCRIHAEFGLDAKPLTCRMFPLQLVPAENVAYLTVRRCCPSAATEQGRPLEKHLPTARSLAQEMGSTNRSHAPPNITPRLRRDWPDASRVLAALRKIGAADSLPLIRQLQVGWQFCALLDQAKVTSFDQRRFGELVDVLAAGAPEEVAEVFRNRQPPRYSANQLFRQVAADYLRLHPRCIAEAEKGSRWKLARFAIKMARGKGNTPSFYSEFPPTTFNDLERPLGALPEEVYRPLNAYFRASLTSGYFALINRSAWSLTESFRALALTYPLALWMLRYTCGAQPPTPEAMAEIVGAIDRGQGYARLAGRGHRWRIGALERMGEIPRLIAWYGR